MLLDKENELNEQIASLNAQCLDLSLVNGRLSSAEATMKVSYLVIRNTVYRSLNTCFPW